MRLVICDDQRLLLDALASALAAHGHLIEAVASTPAEAVRAVAVHDPDVLMLDLGFPNGDGFDAAEEICRHHPRTRIVVLTGSDAPEHVRRALDLGVAAYLRKDQRVERMLEALERVVRDESVYDGSLLKTLKPLAPVPRPRTPIDDLTAREREIAGLLRQGLGTEEIMARLGVSRSTVRTHVHTILAKLGAHSRVQAVTMLAESDRLATTNGSRGRVRR